MKPHSKSHILSQHSGTKMSQTQGRSVLDALIVSGTPGTLVSETAEIGDLSINISIKTVNLFADLSMVERVISKKNNLDTFGSLKPDGKIKISNAFSAPIGYFHKVDVGEARVDIFKTESLQINEITTDDNKISFYNPDLSFNKSVKNNSGVFGGIYALHDNIPIDGDVYTDNLLSASDVHIDILRGPIKIYGDISLQNIQNVGDISLTNNLDISLLEIINLGSYSGSKIIIHSDASFQKIKANEFYINKFTQIGPVISDVSANVDFSVNGNINIANLTSPGIIGIHNDVSFQHLHIQDVSVNTISSITPNQTLIIKGDLSINNYKDLDIEIDQKVINQLQSGELNELIYFTKSALSIVKNSKDKMSDLYYATPAGNFGSFKLEDYSINDIYFTDISISELSYNVNDYNHHDSKKIKNVGERDETFIFDKYDGGSFIDISSRTTYELKIKYEFDQKFVDQPYYNLGMKLIVEPRKTDISYFIKGKESEDDPSGSVGPNSDNNSVEILYSDMSCFTFYFQTNIVQDISMLITLRDNEIESETYKTNTAGNTISRIIDISCGGPSGVYNNFDEIYHKFSD